MSSWRSQVAMATATVTAARRRGSSMMKRSRSTSQRTWIYFSILYLTSSSRPSPSSIWHRPLIRSSSAFSLTSSLSPPPTSTRTRARILASRQKSTVTTTADDSTLTESSETFDPQVIDRLVQQRILARRDGDYDRADVILKQISSHPTIPPGYEICIEDVPRGDGGGSSWSFQPIAEYHHRRLFAGDSVDGSKDDNNTVNDIGIINKDTGPTILQLAHAALGLAVHTSSTYHIKSLNATSMTQSSQSTMSKIIEERTTTQLQKLVEQAHDRLDKMYSVQDDEALYKYRTEDDPTMLSSSQQQEEPSLLTKALLRYELGGRMAADAAFWFALAGIDESVAESSSEERGCVGVSNRRQRQPLLDRLASVAAIELQRYGFRQKRRDKDILQLVERFAAAGVRHHPDLERVVSECLQQKQQLETSTADETIGNDKINDNNQKSTPLLRLHSDHSLFRLWKFSTRQKKQWTFLNAAKRHWESQFEHSNDDFLSGDQDDDSITLEAKMTTFLSDCSTADTTYDWDHVFNDTSRPLVVDIGCGMGVSLLGLASADYEDRHMAEDALLSSQLLLSSDGNDGGQLKRTSIAWSDCNFVGVDLGLLGLRYARGVSKRFDINHRLHFVCSPAEEFLLKLESYPGPIRLCMIQFPTPYRLDTGKGGNSQLPASQNDGFMVTENLLRLTHSILLPHSGKVLIQSNCEDVAVWMRNTAQNVIGFSCLEADYADLSRLANDSTSQETEIRLPQRTIDWRNSGGEQADGQGWIQGPILHRSGRPETEVACTITGTPIHRCILEAK